MLPLIQVSIPYVDIAPIERCMRACHTMRELGSVFQLRRTPSVSSIWLHWSLSASKSAMLGGVYGAAAVVFGQCLVEGNEGAHNSIARGWRWIHGECGGFDEIRAINSVAAAKTGCNSTAGLQGVLSRSSRWRWWARHKRPDWQLRSSIPSTLPHQA